MANGLFVRVTVAVLKNKCSDSSHDISANGLFLRKLSLELKISTVTVRGLIFEDATTTDRIIYNVLY